MSDEIKVLSDTEYCLMKERLLATLREALDAFVILEQSINPNAEKVDFIHAQMEVCMDISSSAALDTGEFTRGEFIDMAINSFEELSELKADEPINVTVVELGMANTSKSALN